MNKKRWLLMAKIVLIAAMGILIGVFCFAEMIDVSVMAATDDFIYSFHEFGDWEEVNAATCQSDGVEISKCLYCNVTRKRITPAFDHCYVSQVVTKPTVYSDGLKRYTCIWCGDSYDEKISALEMTFVDTFVSPDDDPNGKGYVLHTCKQDETYTYTDKLTYTSTVVAPTCLEQGYTLHVCNEGDYSYKSDYTAKTTHNCVEISRSTPTCEDSGVIYYKCSICNSNHTLKLEKLGHNYVVDESKSKAATCTTDGYEYSVCSTCGNVNEEVIPAAHTLTHVEEVEATATADGNIEYWYCTVCKKYFSDKNGTTEIELEDTVTKYVDESDNTEEDDSGTGDDTDNTEEGGSGTGDDTDNTEEGGSGTGDDTGNTEESGSGTGDDTDNTEESGSGTGDDTGNTEESGSGTGDDTGNTEEGGSGTGDDTGNTEEGGSGTGGDDEQNGE